MPISDLGIGNAGRTAKVKKSAKRTARNAITAGFAKQVRDLAKEDAKKGICMDRAYLQLRDARMNAYVSPDRAGPMAQVNSLMKDLAKEQERVTVLLERLIGNSSVKVSGDSISQTAEVDSFDGEVIASYNSFGGGWTIIPTKAETRFMNEAGDIYMKTYRETRTEMNAQAAGGIKAPPASVDVRA